MTTFIAFSLLLSLVTVVRGQVAFPESAAPADKSKANRDGRIPLYSPTRCRQNELLYPGDQVNDWICDCAPAALYYPEADGCFPAFYQGPCPKEQVLLLGPGHVIPQCISNPCKTDGMVPVNGICYPLGGGEPCLDQKWSFVLSVDPTTLTVHCLKSSVALATRFGVDDDAPTYDLSKIDVCARGTKRAIQGRCPERN